MEHTFLLEIGLEELPSKVIKYSESQLKEKIETFLNEKKLSFKSIQAFSTPRRLAVQIEGLAAKQLNESQTIKGPARKIAQDEQGNWTKAAIGFTKGQGASMEDIVFKEVKGEEYLFVEKHIEGENTFEVLKELPKVVTSLSFPVSMKWGNTPYRYIRPIHWIVSLLDDEVVPFTVFDVSTDRFTFGHRLTKKSIHLTTAAEYEEKLENSYVVPNRSKRQNRIIDQIENILAENNWSLSDAESLLDEVTDLVEYPTAFVGQYDASYLEVPAIVLETSMIDHQRYFPVRSKEGNLLPYFIGVRNGDSDYIETVIKGNEKVLNARLADAKFFYEEDKKLTIEGCVDKLKSVSFHEKLGTLFDKQVRVAEISALLAEKFKLDTEDKTHIKRAAEIYKFDLVTNTVVEFTKLQGHIGSIYAEERGEDKEVSEAIVQQYLPDSVSGELPFTNVGAILSLADKLDTLILFFAIGLIPSGSNDPFALRRNAMGIVRILEKYERQLSLHSVLEEISEVININVELKAGFEQNKERLIHFIKDRIDQQLQRKENPVPYDIRQAVLQAKQDDVTLIIDTADILNKAKETAEYKTVVESLTRVANLAEKFEQDIAVNESYFETDSEKELWIRTVEAEKIVDSTVDVNMRYQALKGLSPAIDSFFNENMVMADDEKIKNNRLALLSKLNNLTMRFANLSQLVIK